MWEGIDEVRLPQVPTTAALPASTEAGVQYIVLDDGDGKPALYEWNGAAWVKMADPDAVTTEYDAGSIPAPELHLHVLPIAGNRFSVGPDTYQFEPPGGSVTDDAYIAVAIVPLDLAATTDNAINAIKALDANDQHPTIFRLDGVTPAHANGTRNVGSMASGNGLTVWPAAAPGGTWIPGSPDLALTATMTDASNVWSCGAVNMNTLGGHVAGRRSTAITSIPCTAAMIASGFHQFVLPFTIEDFSYVVKTAAGVQRAGGTDALTGIASPSIQVAFGGGGAPDIQDGDTLTVTAWSAVTP
jgi:hypothetical protein